MTSGRVCWRAVVCLMLIPGILALPSIAARVAAQEGTTPPPRIIRVDTSSFPDIRIYIAGRNLNLQEGSDLRVLEDGITQEQVTSGLERGGTQTALVMDASTSITRLGKTGDLRNVEVGHAVKQLVDRKILSPELDWLTAIVPVAGGGSQVLQSWTNRDYNAVSNAVYQFQPDRKIGGTSLYDLLSDALDLFEAAQAAEPAAARAIVVFSDGVTGESQASLNAVVEKAKRMDVRIHSVLLGEDNTAGGESLQRIAELTGGGYIHLTQIEALDELWKTLVKDAGLQVLTYRSHKPDPGQVTVQVRSGDGASFELRQSVPPISPPPAPAALQLRIVSPPDAEFIERSSENPQAAVAELEPQEIVVDLQLTWPDGHPRKLTSLELSYADKSQSLDVTPLGETLQFTVSIADLAQGSYVLGLSAIDELGLRADTSLPLRIVEKRPAAPTATPAPLPSPAPAAAVSPEENTSFLAEEQRLRTTAIALGALSLVLILVLLLVGLMVLKAGVRRRASELLNSTLGAVTEPFLRGKLAQQSPAARLILVSGGNSSLPTTIDLYSGNALIGREPSLVNVVLRDRHVSRYHCRINQAADESFHIWDEGSTSGTYVNNEPIGMSGRRLQPGDLINIGSVQYRFEPVTAGEAWPGSASLAVDATQPYMPHPEPSFIDNTEVYVPGSPPPQQPQAEASAEVSNAYMSGEKPSFSDSTEVYVPGSTEPYQPAADEPIEESTEVYTPDGTQPDHGLSMGQTDVYEPDGTENIYPEARQPAKSDDWAEIEEDRPH